MKYLPLFIILTATITGCTNTQTIDPEAVVDGYIYYTGEIARLELVLKSDTTTEAERLQAAQHLAVLKSREDSVNDIVKVYLGQLPVIPVIPPDNIDGGTATYGTGDAVNSAPVRVQSSVRGQLPGAR